MSYVKIPLNQWAIELYGRLTALLDPDMLSMEELEGEDRDIGPISDLVEEFVAWATRHFAEKTAPTAKDLAELYFQNARFIDREQEEFENSWFDYCISKGCLFWNMNYGCLADGYYKK